MRNVANSFSFFTKSRKSAYQTRSRSSRRRADFPFASKNAIVFSTSSSDFRSSGSGWGRLGLRSSMAGLSPEWRLLSRDALHTHRLLLHRRARGGRDRVDCRRQRPRREARARGLARLRRHVRPCARLSRQSTSSPRRTRMRRRRRTSLARSGTTSGRGRGEARAPLRASRKPSAPRFPNTWPRRSAAAMRPSRRRHSPSRPCFRRDAPHRRARTLAAGSVAMGC